MKGFGCNKTMWCCCAVRPCTLAHALCYDSARHIAFTTFSTLSNTEGKYGQAGGGARCIDAALLGRRQRGAPGDPALSHLQPAAASTGADVSAMWLQGPS